MNTLIREIEETKKQLEKLEKQYIQEAEPCHNKQCGFYREKSTLNCAWTVLVENCSDYVCEQD